MASKEYNEALEIFRIEALAYMTSAKAFRNMKIGYVEFGIAIEANKEAHKAFDIAETIEIAKGN